MKILKLFFTGLYASSKRQFTTDHKLTLFPKGCWFFLSALSAERKKKKSLRPLRLERTKGVGGNIKKISDYSI